MRADPGECRAYSARIIFEIGSQPFRAGLTFGGRPSGPRIHGDFAVSFLSQPATGKLAAPTARSTARRDRRGRRDDKGGWCFQEELASG